MTVSLKNIIPRFLEKEKTDRSEIWGQDLVFRKGEKSQVVAPSGSGKTSLVHFIYGLRSDYDGDIYFGDKNIRAVAPPVLADLRAARMSIIFQDLRLFGDLTVFQNLAVKRALAPYHSDDRIPEMAERLGIGNKLSQTARTCSYGEQQRIAIIRALQQPFDCIIMDEPFSHLDETNSRKAMALIEEEAAARGAAIILADLEPISFFNANSILHL